MCNQGNVEVKIMEKTLIKLNHESKEIELNKFDDLDIEIDENSSLTLKLLNLDEKASLNISAKVGKDSYLNVVFADFAKSNIKVTSKVNLVEEGASCDWHLATLSMGENSKHFDVSFIHKVGHTNALMDNYGVARDKSKIVFSGINHILNGSVQSNTAQNAKIIVFDKNASGVASPILKIDENDVKASHGAVVGQLNNEHMFYLMSRGLTKEEAKMIITLGYLQPISKNFSEKNKVLIEEAIKEAM